MEESTTHLIHHFQKNADQQVQVSVKKFKGKYYIDLRIWYQEEGGDELKPTKKGVAFAFEQLSELKRAVEKLSKVSEKLRNREAIAVE